MAVEQVHLRLYLIVRTTENPERPLVEVAEVAERLVQEVQVDTVDYQVLPLLLLFAVEVALVVVLQFHGKEEK